MLDGQRHRFIANDEGNEVDTYQLLREKSARSLRILDDGLEDVTGVLALPGKYRRRLRTTNKPRRLIEELRRREKVIRIFPNMDSAWRMIGARLAEYHEEGLVGRRYLKMDTFKRWKEETNNNASPAEPTNNHEPTEATTADLS